MAVILEILYLLAFSLQFLWRIERDVGLAIVEKLLDVHLVYLTTLTLAIRTFVAAEAHAFVKLDAEPSE